jgi:hypothetical protein
MNKLEKILIFYFAMWATVYLIGGAYINFIDKSLMSGFMEVMFILILPIGLAAVFLMWKIAIDVWIKK